MDFTILISNSSELPIYMQIVEQIREQIVLEKIPSNTPLPSIRQLSKDLDISVITVTNAYNKLQIEGFITSLPGKGKIKKYSIITKIIFTNISDWLFAMHNILI